MDNAHVKIRQTGTTVNYDAIYASYVNISGNAVVDLETAGILSTTYRRAAGIYGARGVSITENAAVTVVTTGGVGVNIFTDGAFGIRSGGTMNISTTGKVKVTTTGERAHGIYVLGSATYGGDINISGSDVEVSATGATAYGIYCDTFNLPAAKVTISGTGTTSVTGAVHAFYAAPTIQNYIAVQSGGWNMTSVVYAGQDSGKTSITINEMLQGIPHDGTAKTFNVISTPELHDFSVTYKQSGVTVAAPTNVGSYDVTVTRAEDETYNAFSRYIAAGLVIERLTLNEGTQTVTFDGAAKAFAIREISPVGSNSFAVTYSQNGNTVATPTALGTYDVHILWTGTGGANVYNKTLVNGLVITNTAGTVTVFEDFDSMAPFAINPTNSKGWSYLCGDGSDKTFKVAGYEYANEGVPAYIAFNITQTTPSAASDPKLAPHSGDQFLARFSETGASVYGNDFFVTSLINAGSDIRFGFWARSYDRLDYLGARFKVRYSTTGNAIGDFTNYVAGAAGNNVGQYILATSEWTYYEYFIPKTAKYITINCTSTFFTNLMLMIDDVTLDYRERIVGPLKVTYNANGGSGAVPVDAVDYLRGNTAIVKSEGAISKTDFFFNGWNTAADGTGTAYAPDDSLPISSNVTLYAQWSNTVTDYPTITSVLLDGTYGSAYSQTLAASGNEPITWSVVSGALPTGLMLIGNTVTGTPTVAGDYTFTIEAHNDAGDATKEFSVTVAKKDLTITPIAGLSKTYGDDDPALTYTHDQLVGNDTISGTIGRASGDNAGNYAYTLGNLTASANYTLSLSVGSFTINKKPLTAAMITSIAAATYDGTAQTPAVVVNDTATIASSDYTISYSNNTSAGTGTVTITATAGGNYSGSASKTFPITRTLATISFDPAGGTHVGGGALIQMVLWGETVIEPLISRPGYTFVGFFSVNAPSGGTLFSSTAPVTVSVTYYARYSKIDTSNPLNWLLIQGVSSGSNAIKLTWTRIAEADGYLLYGSKCNYKTKKYTPILIKTFTSNLTLTWTHPSLKAGNPYKYRIEAYRLVDGKKVVIKKSRDVIHVVTHAKSSKKANPVKIKVASYTANNLSLALGRGKSKTYRIALIPPKGKKVLSDKHAAEIRPFSSNSAIANAKYNASAKKITITAKEKGTCYVYGLGPNGLRFPFKVTVK